jgi:Flp pilus assembly protein CpaB
MQTIEAPKPPRPKKKTSSSHIDLGKLVSTRRGMALVGGATAALAALVLMVFLQQYRNSVTDANRTVTVLVAKNLIEKGSSGTIIAEKSIFQSARVRKSDLKNGAVADPANLRGKVTADDIYPGQQLVIGDFVAATGGVRERITGTERAISLPFDNAHGLIGDIQAGDHVDVFVAMATGTGELLARRPVVMTLIRDLLVLRAPKAAKAAAVGTTNTQEVVLRATDAQAAKLSFASETGKVRLVLRPKVGANDTRPDVIDQRTIVLSATAKAHAAKGSR